MYYRGLVVIVFLVGFSSAEHEEVVDRILKGVTEAAVKVQNDAKDFVYTFRMSMGPMNPTFKVSFFMGQLVIEGFERNGTVEYNHEKEEDSAKFSFAGNLNMFVAYRYVFSGAGTQMSSGSVAVTWVSPTKVQMEVGSDDCLLKIVTSSRSTTVFDLDAKPNENTFFPVTVRLPPGNLVEKNLLADLEKALSKAFNGKKICDCFDC